MLNAHEASCTRMIIEKQFYVFVSQRPIYFKEQKEIAPQMPDFLSNILGGISAARPHRQGGGLFVNAGVISPLLSALL